MMSDYEWIDRGRRRERVLAGAMDKPRMPAEARELLGYGHGNKLTSTFKELSERGLLRAKVKGLYGLTKRGQRLRKRLLKEQGIPYSYREPRLDWRTYAWVLIGRQRKALFRVLERYPVIAADLLRLARRLHKALSRTDTYSVLSQFVARKLAQAERNERNVLYSLTRKGAAIKRQMLMAWLLLFSFY